MNQTAKQIAIVNLYREHSYLMQQYSDCVRRDDILQVKRPILKRMKDVEKEIKRLEIRDGIFQIR
jgi:hypothetical protein